ncbi:hypothetical protein ABBQ32_010168 [Trebouxia sp. C0010 RCD-2024]
MSVHDQLDEFCMLLRHRKVEGSLATGRRTAELLRIFISTCRHSDAIALVEDVRSVGNKLQAAKPIELAIGNITRRVLHMIREESEQEHDELEEVATGQQPQKEKEKAGLLSKALRAPLGTRTLSLHNLLDQAPLIDGQQFQLHSLERQQQHTDQLQRPAALQQHQLPGPGPAISFAPEAEPSLEAETSRKHKRGPVWKRKALVIEQINELIDELDEIDGNIALQAGDHIHANEVILTFGMSNTTLLFLKEAAKKRDFQVVVAEGAPKYGGHQMARKLAQAGISTTAIADSAIFAMMARVNKVLVGTHVVLANGGIMAPVGTHVVALAAKHHSCPFVVLTGLHKLSPLFPHDPSVTFNDFRVSVSGHCTACCSKTDRQGPSII